jgi:hypothetical protein
VSLAAGCRTLALADEDKREAQSSFSNPLAVRSTRDSNSRTEVGLRVRHVFGLKGCEPSRPPSHRLRSTIAL